MEESPKPGALQPILERLEIPCPLCWSGRLQFVAPPDLDTPFWLICGRGCATSDVLTQLGLLDSYEVLPGLSGLIRLRREDLRIKEKQAAAEKIRQTVAEYVRGEVNSLECHPTGVFVPAAVMLDLLRRALGSPVPANRVRSLLRSLGVSEIKPIRKGKGGRRGFLWCGDRPYTTDQEKDWKMWCR
jgi:hypothetical protein